MGNLKLAPLPAWLDIDERHSPRLPADFPIMAESNVLGDLAVTIADISTLGALILTPSKLTVGSFVTLKISVGMTYGGWIAWSKADSAGLDFANPARPAAIGGLLGLANSQTLQRSSETWMPS